jgi:hypothetical protein
MFFSPFIIPVIAIVAWALVMISRGPLGQALAKRIAGGSHPPDADTEALRGEVEGMAQRLAEVEERLDFTERVLQQDRGRERLGSGDV